MYWPVIWLGAVGIDVTKGLCLLWFPLLQTQQSYSDRSRLEDPCDGGDDRVTNSRLLVRDRNRGISSRYLQLQAHF